MTVISAGVATRTLLNRAAGCAECPASIAGRFIKAINDHGISVRVMREFTHQEALMATLIMLDAAVPSLFIDAESFCARGTMATVRSRIRGLRRPATTQARSVPVNLPVTAHFTIELGLVVAHEWRIDPDELWTQTGLRTLRAS